MQTAKQLTNRKGYLVGQKSVSVSGYEIHAGISQGEALESPALYLDGQPDGAISADNQIMATYLHGLFDVPEALTSLLSWVGLDKVESFDVAALRERQLERLADMLEADLNVDFLLESVC